MSRYDVNTNNFNRHVRFKIEPTNAADANAALFGMFKGRNNQYPNYGQLVGTPTGVQEVAQLRTSLVIRAVTRYAIPVGVQLAIDSFATPGATANFAPALILTFEQDSTGEFFNNAWNTNTTLAKHQVGNIVDTVGIGGMNAPKTKPGLQGLLDSLFSVTYDGGVSGPFGALSNGGNVVLPNGVNVTGVPVLDNAGGGVPVGTSGLSITYLADF
jgi:hypothetical protein